jgi:hypothetical protein
MSRKTNAAKAAARVARHTKPRRGNRGKRPNPAFDGFLSSAAMIQTIESVAFGEIGCTILRAFHIKPIELLAGPTPHEDDGVTDLEGEV